MIDSDYFWRNIFYLAVGTFCIRASIIMLSSKIKISNRIKEIFSFIPASVLPALIGPMVFYHQGSVAWLNGKERLLVLPFAVVLYYMSKSMLMTILLGLSLLYIISL